MLPCTHPTHCRPPPAKQSPLRPLSANECRNPVHAGLTCIFASRRSQECTCSSRAATVSLVRAWASIASSNGRPLPRRPYMFQEGSRIRDVAQVARKLVVEHHMRLHGKCYDCRDDGTVQVSVVLQEDMQLRWDDPYIRRRRRTHEWVRERFSQVQVHQRYARSTTKKS